MHIDEERINEIAANAASVEGRVSVVFQRLARHFLESTRGRKGANVHVHLACHFFSPKINKPPDNLHTVRTWLFFRSAFVLRLGARTNAFRSVVSSQLLLWKTCMESACCWINSLRSASGNT
jgi:hypothetical protein